MKSPARLGESAPRTSTPSTTVDRGTAPVGLTTARGAAGGLGCSWRHPRRGRGQVGRCARCGGRGGGRLAWRRVRPRRSARSPHARRPLRPAPPDRRARRAPSGSAASPAATCSSRRRGSWSPGWSRCVMRAGDRAGPARASARGSTSPGSSSRSCSTSRCCCTRPRTRSWPGGSGFPVTSITLHFLGGMTADRGRGAPPARGVPDRGGRAADLDRGRRRRRRAVVRGARTG